MNRLNFNKEMWTISNRKTTIKIKIHSNNSKKKMKIKTIKIIKKVAIMIKNLGGNPEFNRKQFPLKKNN